jgi:hypothetical protein
VRAILCCVFPLLLLVSLAPAQTVSPEPCPSLDAADEPHHSVIFRNSAVRLLELQLTRISSTTPHCHQYSCLMVATTESHTTDGAMGTDWYPGDARWIYGPSSSQVRNDGSMTYRAIEVETLRTQTYSWTRRNQYADPFGADQGTVRPTWSQTFSRGGLAATRAQLASGDSLDVSAPDHILIAITDLEVETLKPGGSAEKVSLSRGDTLMFSAGSVTKLTNRASDLAKFVIVEF